MSDIFDRLQSGGIWDNAAAPQKSNGASKEIWDTANEKQEARNETRERNIEKWRFKLSDDQYMALNRAVETGEIDADEGYKLAASIELSRQYNITPQTARENLNLIMAAEFGGDEKYRAGKTAFNAVWNKGRIGINTLKAAGLGNELMEAELSGNKKLTDIINRQLDEIDRTNEDYQDYQKRNWLVGAVEMAAESLPFTLYVGGSGFFGSLLAPGIGTAAAFAASMQVTRGQEYRALRKAGATPETASGVSLVSSAAQSAFEVFLGNALSISSGLSNMAGKAALAPNVTRGLIEKATSNVFKNSHLSGLFLKTALKIGAEYLGETVEEGLEELLQTWTSALSLEAAAVLQKEGVTTKNADEIWEEMAEAFGGGFKSSLILGFAGMGFNARASVKSYQALQANAETLGSKQEFYDATGGSEVFKDMTGEQKKARQDMIYDSPRSKNARDRIARDAARIEALRETADLSEGADEAAEPDAEGSAVSRAEEFRTGDGRLYTQFGRETARDGKTGGTYLVGNGAEETSHNRYGHIDWRPGSIPRSLLQLTLQYGTCVLTFSDRGMAPAIIINFLSNEPPIRKRLYFSDIAQQAARRFIIPSTGIG